MQRKTLTFTMTLRLNGLWFMERILIWPRVGTKKVCSRYFQFSELNFLKILFSKVENNQFINLTHEAHYSGCRRHFVSFDNSSVIRYNHEFVFIGKRLSDILLDVEAPETLKQLENVGGS